MMTKIYDLAYEINGDTISLEQDMGCGDVSRIDLHPIHLRLLAEEAGLLAPSSNIEADRTIRLLCRQMRILFHRIDQLDDWINQASLKGHEDLDIETTYSFATWEMANEFIKQLPLDEHGAPVMEMNAAESGPISNPSKNGSVPPCKTPDTGGISADGQLLLSAAEETQP